MFSKLSIISFFIAIVPLVNIGCESTTPKTAYDYVREYGGRLEVYQEILNMTDCTKLQEKFNIASTNNKRYAAGTAGFKWTLGYMTAADNRMKEIGCYK